MAIWVVPLKAPLLWSAVLISTQYVWHCIWVILRTRENLWSPSVSGLSFPPCVVLSTLREPPPQSGKLIISAYSGVTRRISAAWKILWYFTTICSAADLLWYWEHLIEWYEQNPHWMSIPPHEQPGNSDKAGRSGNLIIMKKAGWSGNHISAVDYCNPGCGTGPLKESSLICVLF